MQPFFAVVILAASAGPALPGSILGVIFLLCVGLLFWVVLRQVRSDARPPLTVHGRGPVDVAEAEQLAAFCSRMLSTRSLPEAQRLVESFNADFPQYRWLLESGNQVRVQPRA